MVILSDFSDSLYAKLLENQRFMIKFLGYRILFESLESDQFVFENSRYTKRVFVCLGNTIGNFDDQNDILNILQRIVSPDDYLILGVQQDTYLDQLLSKYSQNSLFRKMILRCISGLGYPPLDWKINYEKSQIEAWSNGLQVFRSKKYKPDCLAAQMREHDFALERSYEDPGKNICLQVYKKNKFGDNHGKEIADIRGAARRPKKPGIQYP